MKNNFDREKSEHREDQLHFIRSFWSYKEFTDSFAVPAVMDTWVWRSTWWRTRTDTICVASRPSCAPRSRLFPRRSTRSCTWPRHRWSVTTSPLSMEPIASRQTDHSVLSFYPLSSILIPNQSTPLSLSFLSQFQSLSLTCSRGNILPFHSCA